MSKPETAADIVEEAIRILQRNLPGGDLSDHETISELWGLLDNRNTEAVLQRERNETAVGRLKPANDRRFGR